MPADDTMDDTNSILITGLVRGAGARRGAATHPATSGLLVGEAGGAGARPSDVGSHPPAAAHAEVYMNVSPSILI